MISILIKYVDFQKFIPAAGFKNIYSDGRLISRNLYLSQVIKKTILMNYDDFQECIPVSGYKDFYFDKVR